MNKYEKLSYELNQENQKYYSDYSGEYKKLNESSKKSCEKYNHIVGVIDNSRIRFISEIYELHKFLERFGNVGKKITPFEFSTEDTRIVADNKKEQLLNSGYDKNEKNFPGFLKTAIIASTAMCLPMFTPVFAIKGMFNRSKSKKEYYAKLSDSEEYKILLDKSLDEKREEIIFLDTAAKIAKIYLALIETVRIAIKETIIPELMGIDAFLIADAIKNCIISDMDPREAEVLSIDSYKGTAYDMHFVFVKNVFDYYTMIVKIFSEPILTNIVEDNKVTAEEEKEFNVRVRQIEQQTKLLKDTSVFGGMVNE